MKLRFALVGCGSIAKKHAHVLREYLEDAEIGAFVDLDLSRSQAFSAKYGAPAFASVGDMMREIGDGIDVFSVLTPSGAHCGNVLELAGYGRPIVVEKPLALRLDDADRMIEACDAHGVKLFVVHQNRYNPPIVKAREALEQGRFGRLVMGTVRLRWTRDQAYYDSESWRGTWAHDGGVFMNQAVHHIDMLSWFMGSAETVRSMAATRLPAASTVMRLAAHSAPIRAWAGAMTSRSRVSSPTPSARARRTSPTADSSSLATPARQSRSHNWAARAATGAVGLPDR